MNKSLKSAPRALKGARKGHKKGKKTNSSHSKRTSRIPRGLTTAGTRFLQAATAAPDFADSTCMGVPDLFGGKSFCKQFVLQQTVTVQATQNSTFVVLPTPGVAYWVGSGAVLSTPTSYTGVQFPDASNLFPTMAVVEPLSGIPVQSSRDVDRFRFCGLSAELVSNMNGFTWAGTVQCTRSQIRRVDSQTNGTGDAVVRQLEGLDAVSNLITGNGQTYTDKSVHGVYSVSCNRDATFEFKDVTPGAYSDSKVTGYFDSTPYGILRRAELQDEQYPAPPALYRQTGATAPPNTPMLTGSSRVGADTAVTFTGPMVGLDDFEAIIFRVTNPSVTPQSFTIKVWQNIEFTPQSGSVLDQIAKPSPPHDPRALEFYKLISESLPMGVPAAQNANFWEWVKKALRTSSAALSLTPGSIGTVAKGVSEVMKLF